MKKSFLLTHRIMLNYCGNRAQSRPAQNNETLVIGKCSMLDSIFRIEPTTNRNYLHNSCRTKRPLFGICKNSTIIKHHLGIHIAHRKDMHCTSQNISRMKYKVEWCMIYRASRVSRIIMPLQKTAFMDVAILTEICTF